MDDIKNTIKIANQIEDALLKLRNHRYVELLNQLGLAVGKLRELTETSKRLAVCLSHNWLSASEVCGIQISGQTKDITYYLSQLGILADKPIKPMPTLSVIVEDIKQLQREFNGVEFDRAGGTVSVVTGPITLDDVYLGPFRIQLELKKLAELYKDNPYYCIALDPHPAATNEDVTHPHVSNDILCEGEGSAVIKAALEEDRLCDFFMLVKGILNTYSPDSPYVSLEEWDGEPCYECGYVMNRENSYYCNFCGHSFCEECTTCCRGCDETVCAGCSSRCEICEEIICPNCVQKCPECGVHCCPSCLEEGICPNCQEELENENENRTKQPTRTTTNPNPGRTEASGPVSEIQDQR